MKRFFPAKGTIYYVAIATVIFSLFSGVKISYFRAKAHLVFHWCLYNKTYYYTLYSLSGFSFGKEPTANFGNEHNLQIGADKGWAVKRARPSKRCGLGSNYGPHAQIKETVNIKGISGKRVMSLKGFVNRLSNYCQIDIRELKEPRRCSRLRRLLTRKRLSQ